MFLERSLNDPPPPPPHFKHPSLLPLPHPPPLPPLTILIIHLCIYIMRFSNFMSRGVGLLTLCIVPRGGFLYRMIVLGGGFLLPSSRVPGVCPRGDGYEWNWYLHYKAFTLFTKPANLFSKWRGLTCRSKTCYLWSHAELFQGRDLADGLGKHSSCLLLIITRTKCWLKISGQWVENDTTSEIERIFMCWCSRA